MRNRTRNTTIAAAALLAASLGALSLAQGGGGKAGTTASASMPKTDRMTMAEFKKLAAANAVVIVDVRSLDAYVSGHIPGALSIPEETINASVAEKLKKMGKPVATYCS
jgi:phage shock protein E